MDLTPYLETLRRDLAASAAPGGPEVQRAAELLTGALESSGRLCLMQALADAADEITAELSSASVEVRLRGRDAELAVTEIPAEPGAPPAAPPSPAPPLPPPDGSGEVARITLRLPEGLKEAVERAAGAEGISVNAWLVRIIGNAVQPAGDDYRPRAQTESTFPPGRASLGRRFTGYAQA